jgi:hypothetical protein
MAPIWPLSTNGPKNNDKEMKRLAEPIDLLVREVLFPLFFGVYVFFASAQSACRAMRMPIDNPYRCFWAR